MDISIKYNINSYENNEGIVNTIFHWIIIIIFNKSSKWKYFNNNSIKNI